MKWYALLSLVFMITATLTKDNAESMVLAAWLPWFLYIINERRREK